MEKPFSQDEQESLRSGVREFVQKELPPEYVRRCDETGTPPMDKYRQVAELGFLGIGVPEKYGGIGGGMADLAVVLEELARGFFELAVMVYRSAVHGAHAFLSYGSEEQRAQYISRILAGELLTCLSLTEPNAGSDAKGVALTATRDGSDWIINGQKVFSSAIHIAHYVLLVARTSEAPGSHKGLTLFFVDTRTPGIEIRPISTLGWRSVSTNEVNYQDVRVPGSQVVGTVDQGWQYLMTNLERERLCIGAYASGGAQAALDLAVGYASDRVQFGRPITQFQAVQHHLANMAVQVHTSRTLTYDLANKLDAGLDCRKEAAITKLVASEAYFNVSDLGMQVMGGYGYTMEYDMQRHFRDSRLLRIGGGTSEIMRNIIAKDVLGRRHA